MVPLLEPQAVVFAGAQESSRHSLSAPVEHLSLEAASEGAGCTHKTKCLTKAGVCLLSKNKKAPAN